MTEKDRLREQFEKRFNLDKQCMAARVLNEVGPLGVHLGARNAGRLEAEEDWHPVFFKITDKAKEAPDPSE